jgi:hypothetical protein
LERELKPLRRSPQQRKSGRFVRTLAALIATVVGILIALGLASLILPKSLNPFYPLKPEDDIGPLTRWKLQAFALNPPACREFLRAANVTFTEVPNRSEQGFCHVKDAVKFVSGGPPFSPNSPTMSCPVAAGLIIWERKALATASQDMMGAKITGITHLGTYNCRRQYGRATGFVSEHASANAIDIQGFTFSDGRQISLLKDWNPRGGQSTAAANFLREAQQGACDVFKVVLGPEANAAHRDHFHLDMGPMSSCR